ncbi:MAG: hypothetical protein COA34_003745 [Methylophaga sp.]|uniref:hypothetical protein n=1 Tax=Methylophaga sp. TaxID=2024840 RepID=UPI002173A934|nr:hypothetical protein [Methylophaga sp.]MBL1456962.1 hypothetical protein [Methylophaga sp.]
MLIGNENQYHSIDLNITSQVSFMARATMNGIAIQDCGKMIEVWSNRNVWSGDKN